MASNLTDGNQATYWESANNAFPQWGQVDLGNSIAIDQVVLKLPIGWGARTQTLSVQGSADGASFATIVSSTGHSFSGTNVVTINFGSTVTRFVRIDVTANTGWPAAQLSELEVYGTATSSGNLAAGKAMSESSHTDIYPAGNANDGNQATYWESANNAFPQWLQVDLAASVSVNKVVIKLPTGWGSRNQTFAMQGSADGTTFSDIVAPASYAFNPVSGNSVTINFDATTTRWVRLLFTANSGWPAGQVSEFEVYGPGTGDTTPPSVPGTLSYTQNGTNTTLSWGASTDTGGSGLAGYDIYRDGALATGVGAGTTTYTDTQPTTLTVSYFVRARDGAGNQSGAPSGQVAELEVCGTPAPNPDLTVNNVTWSPADPVENQVVTLSATVNNIGDLASAATAVNFYLGHTLKGTANVGAIAAGGSATVNLNAGTIGNGTYVVTAKVDVANAVIERNEANNGASGANSLVVTQIQSADLVPVVAWSPSNPSAGNTVTFTVAITNQGNIASSSGSHGITLTLLNDQGATVITRTGSTSGAIAAGATTSPVNLGTWTAVNGRYTVRVVLAADSAEDSVKQGNNTRSAGFFAGRGANMPYDMYEAEDGTVGGGAQLLSPNRTIGDLAGEASGRRAVTLASTGSFVQWVTKAPTNTVVTRFSIPDSAGGGGITSPPSIYVNGTLAKTITLNSKYAWLYGAEAGPGNSPGAGAPRHIYDEANIVLDSTVPAGATIKLQRDSGHGVATIDFINLEQVAPIANPDPTRYVVPAGFTQQDVQNALDTARQDTTKLGVYLPAVTYPTSNKFTVYGRGIQVVGAGPWYTRFETPQSQENTDAGFDVQSSGSGSTFKNLSFWGNCTSRVDGPGKVWGGVSNVNNLTIDNTWVEHTIVSYWGIHSSGLTYSNGRIRNTFADGLNMTSGSTNAHVINVDARGNGDDAFALFSAIDGGGSVGNHDNVYENLSATLTWRAAGVAVYGGYNNIFRNLYIADQLTYPGITISSLDFGYPFVGFGTVPTRIENVTIARAGGHFWGNQVFPAIWCFAASKEFRGIRVTDVDIIDPTYGGIMFQTKYSSPTTPENPVTDTIFTNLRISGAVRSGDQLDVKSGWGIWANEMPEAGQGPAVGSATFNTVTFTDVFQNVRNTTTTFTVTINP